MKFLLFLLFSTAEQILTKKLNGLYPCLVTSSSSEPELAQKRMIKSEPTDIAKKIKLELVEHTNSNETDVVSLSSGVNGSTDNDDGISDPDQHQLESSPHQAAQAGIVQAG